jgi:aspergillopepsin I
MSLLYLLSLSALLGGSYSKPLALESLSAKKSFTLEEVAVPRRRFWGAPEKMRRTYLKYGLDIPYNVYDAAEAWANGTNQASVPVRPVKGDVEYLINVTVGNHVLSLDMDTGSSDL